ncbi:MAG: DUF2147 domain-containing protein [Devosiaceae bacterium]|nr:DUF2147 domain-containing protein [Devosiaceae bacterium]
MIFSKLKTTLIAVVISLSSIAPVLAEPMNPTGLWQADDGESRYEVSLCGDGTQLCAKLVWIQPDKIKAANKVYIDTYVVNKIKRATDREWRGNISLYGVTVSGNVQAYSNDKLVVRGCALIVICIKQGLTRMAVAN